MLKGLSNILFLSAITEPGQAAFADRVHERLAAPR